MKKIKLERCDNCNKVVDAKLVEWVDITKQNKTSHGDEETSESERWCKKCRDAVK